METKRDVQDFFDVEYLDYARYVVENRAIPSVIDGFKPTHRKIIHAANNVWKTGNEKPMKVFQLAGVVASTTFYHHGNCLDGDTRVHLEDMTTISLNEWVQNFPDKSMKILAWCEKSNKLVFDLSSPPFKGQMSYEEISIELENGDTIKCTPDHLLLLENGNWIEAQYLTELHTLKSFDNM